MPLSRSLGNYGQVLEEVREEKTKSRTIGLVSEPVAQAYDLPALAGLAEGSQAVIRTTKPGGVSDELRIRSGSALRHLCLPAPAAPAGQSLCSG